jgi:hypothetical protein
VSEFLEKDALTALKKRGNTPHSTIMPTNRRTGHKKQTDHAVTDFFCVPRTVAAG